MLGPLRETEGLLRGRTGRSEAIDVTVVSPVKMEVRYNVKMRMYHDSCEAQGIVFLPLVVDTFEGWHDTLRRAMKVGWVVGKSVVMQCGS